VNCSNLADFSHTNWFLSAKRTVFSALGLKKRNKLSDYMKGFKTCKQVKVEICFVRNEKCVWLSNLRFESILV